MRRRLLPLLLLTAFATLPWGVPAALAEQVVEHDDDGRVTAKYSTDDEGRRHGNYAEFHENGAIKLKSIYRRGRLHGKYVSYHPSGRPHVTAEYKKGEREGKYVEKDDKGRVVIETTYSGGVVEGSYEEYAEGELISKQLWEGGVPVDVDGVRPYPKSRDAIRDAIEAIYNHKDPLEDDAGDPEAWGRGECLRHLMIYRYLCDLPYADMVLDAELNSYADAGAALCEVIGRLDHTPANPGLPEDEYDYGYIGTSRSNLYMGQEDIVPQVRGYMDDSDPSNIDAVGHRRWCLNAPLMKVGFGRKGKFGAMMCQDRSRRGVPDYDLVAFPPRGWMPAYWFAPHFAWSVSLNRRHFDKPDAGKVKVTIRPLGDDYVRRAEPLTLNHLKVNTSGAGDPYCIIFRAAEIDTEPGTRYWVEITGLTKRGKPVDVKYVTSFFEL
jgi:hypothetical protein